MEIIIIIELDWIYSSGERRLDSHLARVQIFARQFQNTKNPVDDWEREKK